MSTEDISQKNLFTNKSLLMLREKQFNIYEFFAGTLILDMKYGYLRSKHNSSFYFSNNELHYAITYYFTKLKIIKSNINKFLIDLLINSIFH